MKRPLLYCLLLAAVTSIQTSAETIDVFFLAGQSNASGRVYSGYTEDARDSQVLYYYQSDGPSAANVTSGGEFTTLQPLPAATEYGYDSGFYGPEITLGRALVDQGYNTAIIKVSDGGTNLRDDWNPNGSGTENTMWLDWQSQVANALSTLNSEGYTINLRAFFWYQGESDADNAYYSSVYETYFTSFTTEVYAYLGDLGYDSSNMQFVTALIHEDGAYAATDGSEVRAAQQSVMDTLDLGAWFDTSDLTLQSDNMHLDASSIQTVGERFASTYAAAVPEPASFALGLGFAAMLTIAFSKIRRR